MSEPSLRLPVESRFRKLNLFLVGIALAGLSLWLAILVTSPSPSLWQRDWYCLYSAGGDFLRNGADGIYARPCAPWLYWLYPPYMLYPYAVASILPPLVFYALVAVEIIGLTGFSLRLLAAASPEVTNFRTFGLFVLASAAFNATVVTGQHSAILLTALAGALWAFRAGRPVVAGLFLGLLAMKPNWAVVFALWLLFTRRWKAMAVMVTVCILAIATTLPMGIEVWQGFLTETPRRIASFLDPQVSNLNHKLVTFEAFSRTTLGRYSEPAGRSLAILLGLFAAASALNTWLNSPRVGDQLAITVLVVLAGNVYAQFYDTLVLAVPAAIWWTERGQYTRRTWTLVGTILCAIWVWQWLRLYVFGSVDLPYLVGGFLAVWIAAETWRVVHGDDSETAETPA